MKTTNTRTLKLGSYYMALCLIVIAIAVALNLVAAKLPANLTKLDTTDTGIYTLSQTTEDIVAGLDQDVTFYLIAESGAEDAKIQTLLERYTALSRHISFQTVDPAARPDFVTGYTKETLASNSVIAVGGNGRSYIVSYDKIYTVDVSALSEQEQMYYQYYGASSVSPNVFAGESALTSAIDYLNTDTLPKVYALSGHGEYAIADVDPTVSDDITAENIAIEELKLTTSEAVPADAAAVLINLPTEDLLEDELKKLTAYMDGGGNVLLITAPSAVTGGKAFGEMSNLTALTKHFGMVPTDGVIYEADSGYYSASDGVFCLLPKIGTSSAIVERMASLDITVVMQYAHGITALPDEERGTKLSVLPLLSTSDSAFAKQGDSASQEKEDGDIDGPFYVGADAAHSETGAHMVWYSSFYIEGNIGGNESMLLATLLTLCDKEAGSISIDGKSIATTSLTVPEKQQAIWGNITMIGVPVVIVLIGLLIWIRRRKK